MGTGIFGKTGFFCGSDSGKDEAAGTVGAAFQVVRALYQAF
jgi:hypothetical protein